MSNRDQFLRQSTSPLRRTTTGPIGSPGQAGGPGSGGLPGNARPPGPAAAAGGNVHAQLDDTPIEN